MQQRPLHGDTPLARGNAAWCDFCKSRRPPFSDPEKRDCEGVVLRADLARGWVLKQGRDYPQLGRWGGPVSCPTGSPWPLRVKYSTALSHDAYIVISNTGKCLCFHRGSKSSTMVRLQGNVGALRRGAEEGPGLRPTPPPFQRGEELPLTRGVRFQEVSSLHPRLQAMSSGHEGGPPSSLCSLQSGISHPSSLTPKAGRVSGPLSLTSG